MDSAEVVVSELERQCRSEVLPLFRESISQPHCDLQVLNPLSHSSLNRDSRLFRNTRLSNLIIHGYFQDVLAGGD